ncbi:hypothetical protein Q31b_42380 [Novipirellula aureliae]|uniref:Phage-related minor tail protein n=1 Tax=Novipirellula aureliae TaxID=2527966 RepID=A0A5C6DPD1_9BACT|nr:hypothetical protein [Novipirellula aureliae]TWU39153.1 hypothetical protein Q31b_42380 [Novipirellula aureliae]
MSTKVIVELTPDEEKVLNAFRRVQAADEKTRSGLKQTGDVGAQAGKTLGDSFIKGGIDGTKSVSRLIAELKRSGDVGKSVGGQLDKHLSDIGVGGKRSIEQIIASIERLQPEVAERAKQMLTEFRKADQASKFEATRKELEGLGGDFRLIGVEIRKATDEPLVNARKRASEIVDKLRAIDPTKAEAIATAMERADKSISDSRLESFVGQLAKGSKEAQQLASLLGDKLRSASLDAEGGVDGIAQKIIALRPEMKSTVDTWRKEMAEASKFGEGQYEKVLNSLRRGDSVSKQVAEKMKQHLLDVGKVVEPSFEDMIRPLEKLDPKMAAEARRMHAHFDGIKDKSNNTFKSAGAFALEEIAAIGTAYLGLQELVGLVSKAMEDQRQRLVDASEGHRSFATAQQEAFKNLSTLPSQQQVEILTTGVKQIAMDEGIADLASIAKGFGDVRSAGANVPQMYDAVGTSAKINGLTQDLIDEVAVGLFDVMKATGINNAKQSANLVLAIGSEAKIKDPGKLVETMAPIANAGANAADPLRRSEAATDAMALGAALSKAGGDDKGESTRTATMALVGRVDAFFDRIKSESQDANKALASLRQENPLSEAQQLQLEQLRTKSASKDLTDSTITTLESKLSEIQATQDQQSLYGGGSDFERTKTGQRKRELKEELSTAYANRFTDEDAAKLADFEARLEASEQKFRTEVSKLKSKVAKNEALKSVPLGTPGEQVLAFRGRPELQAEFLQERFGEERFRPGIDKLIRGGQTLADFEQARQTASENRGSDRLFQQQLYNSRHGTSHVEEATFQRYSEAAAAIQNTFSAGAALQGSIRKSGAKTLRETRSPGLQGFGQSLSEIGIDEPAMMGLIGGTLKGSAGLEEGFSLFEKLTDRLKDLRRDGVTNDEAPMVDRVEMDIENLFRRMQSRAVRDANPEELENTYQRAHRLAGLIRNNGTTNLPAVRENSELYLRMEKLLADQLRMQRETLDEMKLLRETNEQSTEANKKTEKNTRLNKPTAAGAQQTLATRSPGAS